MMVAARNLSTIIRAIFGIGGRRTPQWLFRHLQTAWNQFERLLSALDRLVATLVAPMPYGRGPSAANDQTVRHPETTWAKGC
jgi:hypothetical protein